MTPSVARRRRSRTAPSRETLQGLADFVTRRTQTMTPDGLGLRIKWGRLPEEEVGELVGLQLEAEASGDGFKLDQLSKKKVSRWEQLVAKGAGEPESFFEDRRQAAEIAQLAAEAHRAAVRKPIRRAAERTIFSELAAQVVGGYLHSDHIAVLTMILLTWEAGVALAPRSRVETIDGLPVLVLDASFGIVVGDLDERGILAAWKQGVAHLELNAWIEVARNGNEWTIAPGLRAKRAMSGSTAA